MPRLWDLSKGLLFRLDAEKVHRAMIGMVRLGRQAGGLPLRLAAGPLPEASAARANVLGMPFRSRVGLAAGFDKDAEILEALPELGFGFAEIGTVTPLPQPGNPRPRLFRDPERQAIFNRMGFNGAGAAAVAARLERARTRLPGDFRVGVNLGKNKDTALDDAAADYARAAAPFEGLADYLVVNVSSPNTPGLRSLQSARALLPIVAAIGEVISGWTRRPPLLLKLAPELEGVALRELIEEVERAGIDGFVLTNTLGGSFRSNGRELEGGWSGGPLTSRSRARLLEAREATKLPIISVGGILSAEEAGERVRSGAQLIQIYSGWIYRGPGFPAEISWKLAGIQRDSGA
ncbi:MAG: quinone-dependent dihydroorotate dehydrogenase [Oligoflexia bacterium]|nr:quinone-dependent dihydroorotate dehydrogenase [Oligoflexia bacterium]